MSLLSSESFSVNTTTPKGSRRNRNRGAPEAYFRSDSIAVRTLKAALDCRLHDLDLSTLGQFTMGLAARTVDLKFCAQAGSQVNDLFTVRQCCNNASSMCRKSSTVVAKVIRLSMQQAQSMMEEDENVKLIHLFRDPRGMSVSQVYRRFYPWEFNREVGNFCSRIWQDLQQHAKLAQEFPFRTLLVRYEDIVLEPIKTMQQIYDYIGIHFGPLLQKQTLRMSEDKRRPHLWRTKIEAEQAAVVERHCAPLFHVMGYREFPNNASVKDLRFNTTNISFAEGWPGAVVLVGNAPLI
ncbi:carbohydrate sulfotransferase 3-like [Elysia marginata]|uniref:Carbohydrate sulfotransferase 3-like n=1 Tax=Elysia marginata TaxID=1093978 RepID=A0AAV4FBI2_9GAST|nr:carbohydrate sulfotransferase 3-like [Elysia marginata]